MPNNRATFLAASAALLPLAGCAGLPISTKMGSPLDSKDEVNTNLFTDPEKQKSCLADLKACVSAARVPLGTLKADVFLTLGMNPDAFATVNKQSTQIELYGNTLYIPFEQRAQAQNFMNSLEGLTAVYRDVTSHKKYGLTSSRIDTDGISVTFNMVFQDGKLFNPITAISVPVDGAKNDGYFNSLGIDGLLKAVKPF